MQQSVVYTKIVRPPAALIEVLKGIPVADLHDEMDPIQRRTRLMHHTMRPLFPSKPFVGPAITAYNTPGDNLMMHTALYYAEKGDVIVVTNGGIPHGAIWGGNASIQATKRGVVALVADGPVRDTAQVKEYPLGVWSTFVSVAKPGKEMPGTVNMPITCAGVMVNPGDIVVGDEDGVIVIDPADAQRLATAARARIKRDDAMQAAIAKGSTLFEQIGCPDRLKALNAVIIDGPWKEG